MEIEIELNGAARRIERDTTVARLVESLGLVPEQVAVEINATLLSRGRHEATKLEPGDRVELVTLVGGG